MTQTQLHRQVARITGEPLSRVSSMGFSVTSLDPADLEPEDVQLVLDCPFCRRPVPYPGPAGDGSETLAECDRCDVYFEFGVEEVYTLPSNHHAGGANQCGDPEQVTSPREPCRS